MEVLKEMLVFTPEFSKTLIVLAIVILCDIATGVLNAIKNNCLKSSRMREGLTVKFGYVIGVVASYAVGCLVGQQNMFGIGAAGLLCVNEAVSIVENLGSMGIPLPAMVTNALETLKAKYSGEETTGAHETKE